MKTLVLLSVIAAVYSAPAITKVEETPAHFTALHRGPQLISHSVVGVGQTVDHAVVELPTPTQYTVQQNVQPISTKSNVVVAQQLPLQVAQPTLKLAQPVQVVQPTLKLAQPVQVVQPTLKVAQPVQVVQPTLKVAQPVQVVQPTLKVAQPTLSVSQPIIAQQVTPIEYKAVNLPPKEVKVPVTKTHVEIPIHQQVHYGTQQYVAGQSTQIHKPSLAAPVIAPPNVLKQKVTYNAPEVTVEKQDYPVVKSVPEFVEKPFHAGNIVEYTAPQINEVEVPTPYKVQVHQPVAIPQPVPVVTQETRHITPVAQYSAQIIPQEVQPIVAGVANVQQINPIVSQYAAQIAPQQTILSQNINPIGQYTTKLGATSGVITQNIEPIVAGVTGVSQQLVHNVPQLTVNQPTFITSGQIAQSQSAGLLPIKIETDSQITSNAAVEIA